MGLLASAAEARRAQPPRHWAQAYVGAPETDCAALVERVLAERFRRAVRLPSERRAGAFGESAQIAAERDRYAEPVHQPVEGDGVLMRAHGRLQHIGIYAAPGGVPHVLHATPRAGVVLHRVVDLPRQGYEVAGFYRWR